MKKYINEIGMLLLIFILIIASIIVRKNSSFYILQIIILLEAIIYIIIKKIKKEPIKIIRNKLDLLMLGFTITTFIPIIFNTYVNLNFALTIALNYVCLYFVYVITSQLCNEKTIKILEIVIVFIAIIFVIVGIENITTNKILPFLNLDNIVNGETRLVSFFGNPNVLASYLTLSLFISMHKIIETKKIKQKILFNICNLLLVIGILLTYSKSIFVIMPIMMMIYLICLRDKDKVIENIQNLISYIIIGGIYIILFKKITLTENYILVWLYIILVSIIEGFIVVLNSKIKDKVKKIKTRYICLVIILFLICLTIFIKIETENIVKYEVFNSNNTSDYEAKKVYNIEGNKEYIIKFDIKASSYEDNNVYIDDMFTINIIERDKRNFEIKNTEIVFGNYEGIKEVEINTHENTNEFKIEFKTKYKFIKRNLTIEHLWINDEEIALNYRNIPIMLVDKIKDININYKTLQERIVFIKDALKLSKENILTGIGGECWSFKYGEVQEYNYTSTDIHSYPTQILLEFGIFGFIILCIIYISIIKMKINPKILGLKIGFIVIIIHSVVDSDLKYAFMQLLVYIIVGIFSSLKYNNEIKNKKINEVINITHIIVAIIVMYLITNKQIYFYDDDIKVIENARIGLNRNSEQYKEYDKELANIYEKMIKYEKNNIIQKYTNFLVAYIDSGQTEKIEKYYNDIKQYENKWKQKPEKIIQKSRCISNILQSLINQGNAELYVWITKFSQIIIDEYEKTKYELNEALRKQYLDSSIESNELEIFYENAKNINQAYILGVQVNNTTEKEITTDLLIEDENLKIENKEILIYHTHTTEAYAENDKYLEIEYKKTLDENYNVIRIGKVLEEELRLNDIQVKHVTKYNDLNGFYNSYDNSRKEITKLVEEENIQIIFDIHRDTGYGENIVIDEKNTAKLRFVIASGYDGWEERLNWAVKIQKLADKKYPNLFKPILIYNNRYNQDIGKYATLIEVGDENNNIQEAENAVILFANILEEIIKEQEIRKIKDFSQSVDKVYKKILLILFSFW